MGSLSHVVFGDLDSVETKKAKQIVLSLDEEVKKRLKALKGASTKPGRPVSGHSYNDSLKRVFVFMDAVGWQPCSEGYGKDIWWGDRQPDEAYADLIEGVTEKLDRKLTIAEMVMFAQWKGYGRADLARHPWLTGEYHEMVRENLEAAEAMYGGAGSSGAPAEAASAGDA